MMTGVLVGWIVGVAPPLVVGTEDGSWVSVLDISSGMAVHTSGKARGEAVRVGIMTVEISVGGGYGLMLEFGLLNTNKNRPARKTPAIANMKAR